MANLATVGSHTSTGWRPPAQRTRRHTSCFLTTPTLWPDKFSTSPMASRPGAGIALAIRFAARSCLDGSIGTTGSADLSELKKLEPSLLIPGFLERWGQTKLALKRGFSNRLHSPPERPCCGSLLAVRCAGQAHPTKYKAPAPQCLQGDSFKYLRIKNGTAMAKPPHRDLRCKAALAISGQIDHSLSTASPKW